MIAQLAVFALSLAVLTATVAPPAMADDDRRWRRHDGHSRGWKDDRRHWHGSRARIVIWQPAPVYRPYPIYRPVYPAYPAYPAPVYAPAPVYVPAPVVVQQPSVNAVPLRSFQDTSGRYCREYQRTADIGGVPQQIYGTACMMPDGSWQIVSE